MEPMTILVIGTDHGERAGLKRAVEAALPTPLRVLDAGKPGDALALLDDGIIDVVVATQEAAAGGWTDFVEEWVGDNPAAQEFLFLVAPPADEMQALFGLH